MRGDNISTVGDNISTVEGIQYSGGRNFNLSMFRSLNTGGCSVHRGDNISTVGG